MNRLLLGVKDYEKHGTDEGFQLEAGVARSGWTVAYGHDCKNVPVILKQHKPQIVLSHDQCDWHKDFPGCFDPAGSFEDIECLAKRNDIFKVVIVKDASTMQGAEKDSLARKVKADAVVLYYHPDSALKLAPWLKKYKLIRHYHSIDRNKCLMLAGTHGRERAIVSGAIGHCYPIRQMVWDHSDVIGCQILGHPGYGNIGHRSSQYLETLSKYRVHVATASEYGFALRKIIESVAVGCTPVTNLPEYDRLPEIDEALIRISNDPTVGEIKAAVDRGVNEWDLDRAVHFARKAWDFYDWRIRGAALSKDIENEAIQRLPVQSRTQQTTPLSAD